MTGITFLSFGRKKRKGARHLKVVGRIPRNGKRKKEAARSSVVSPIKSVEGWTCS